MNFEFLGTSAGSPTKERNVTALILSRGAGKKWFLIDCGEGTQHQLLKTGFSVYNLEAIFITHSHGDHCYGLPGLLASASMSGRTQPLTLVAPRNLRKFIGSVVENTYLNLNFEIIHVDVESLDEPLEIGSFKVQKFPLSHVVPSYAYRFEEINIPGKLDIERLKAEGIESGPVWGRLFRGETILLENGNHLKSKDYLLPGRKARCILIAGDNDTPELLTEACVGVGVLVHESTWTKDISVKIGKDPQHCTAEKIAAFAEQNQIPCLVLTHFSPRYQSYSGKHHSIKDIEKEARDNYSGNLFLAKDFDQYSIQVNGEVGLMS